MINDEQPAAHVEINAPEAELAKGFPREVQMVGGDSPDRPINITVARGRGPPPFRRFARAIRPWSDGSSFTPWPSARIAFEFRTGCYFHRYYIWTQLSGNA
jgi:hypothetical protein